MRTHRRLGRGGALGVAVVAAALLCAAPAGAFRLYDGETVQMDLDTTLSYGLQWRVQARDKEIVGVSNGGEAYSVNGDDGNLNYDPGLISNVFKVTSEAEIRADQFGAFARGSFFYDFEAMGSERNRTDLTEEAKDRVGRRVELLDAYLWGDFDLGVVPLQVRVGEQVVSWGESTFIQGGINTVNPIDVSAIRVPGAELREALKPEGMVWASLGLTENFSLEGLYLYDWEETVIDPPGTYWSTNDFAGKGGKKVMLGFGGQTDNGDASVEDTLLAVPRGKTGYADDQGQFGVALRAFAPGLNDTEFGFFYLRYNSRLPLISSTTGTLAGAGAALTIKNTAPAVIPAAITAALTDAATNPSGTAADHVTAAVTAVMTSTDPTVQALVASDAEAAQLIAGASAQAALEGGASAGAAAGSTTASGLGTDRYAKTARYRTEYPEDLQLFGVSFNTMDPWFGVAIQGEVSYRPDAPLQVDDLELLFATLGGLDPYLATHNQLGNYNLMYEQDISGYIERDVTQVQATATKVFGPGLGADSTVVLAEVGYVHVRDMPDTDELRMESAGTYISGNADLAYTHGPGADEIEPSRAFADANSWGYRAVAKMTFNNAIGAWALSPRVAWAHDVSGNTPGPGGAFLEGRKAVTLGLGGNYQNAWTTDLSYTNFFGAGRYNLVNDRDFVAFNVKYSF